MIFEKVTKSKFVNKIGSEVQDTKIILGKDSSLHLNSILPHGKVHLPLLLPFSLQ